MANLKTLPRIDGEGVIDMHVHTGPEFLQRRYDPITLAEEARREGIGIVMKNHFQPTTAWAIMAREPGDEVAILGSVALNHSCGGISDHAVRGALSGWKTDPGQIDPDPQRFVVWMPTFCAEAHLSIMGRRDIPLDWGVKEQYSRLFDEAEGLTIRDDSGAPVPGLDRALRMIAENDLILATGHVDAEETKDLVRHARAAGIKRIVLTHPLWDSIELTPDELSALWRDHGAYSELCFVNLAAHGMDKLTIDHYVEVIEAVGAEGVILSSDLGQTFTMPMAEGLKTFFALLAKAGVNEDDIARMSILNPREILFGDAA